MSEREEVMALRDADTLHMLPPEALIASIKYLAERLLGYQAAGQAVIAAWDAIDAGYPERHELFDLAIERLREAL